VMVNGGGRWTKNEIGVIYGFRVLLFLWICVVGFLFLGFVLGFYESIGGYSFSNIRIPSYVHLQQ
jgi:hypothetical protein